jgi:hypothetical protein
MEATRLEAHRQKRVIQNQTIVVGDGFGRLHFLQLVEANPTKPSIGETKYHTTLPTAI